VLSGLWSGFFHNVSDFFGMENYFVKMKTDPEVVRALTERVVNFYEQANDRLFSLAGLRPVLRLLRVRGKRRGISAGLSVR